MTDTLRARAMAKRLYPRSKNFQGAFVKGASAARAGHPESACPYARDPAKTWRLAYRKAWMRGHQSVPRRVD